MRSWLPLLPPWLLGAWVLATSPDVWDAESLGPNLHGDSLAAGWMLLGTLVAATLLHVFAPQLGRKLAVSTNSSMLAGLGSPNGAQRDFGATTVRAFALVSAYVVSAAIAFG